jgi:membrane AbrB-like protein
MDVAAWPRAGRLALTLLLALAAALACVQLHVPLPWMIGPLLLTAALTLRGVPVVSSARLRNGGQALIGVALGLYFTPVVVALLISLAPAITITALWALAMGWGFYRFLLHLNGGDRTSAFFAAAIGGASEMAVLAERHGGQVDRVAASHSLRVLMVVVLIPFAFQAWGVHGADATLPAVQDVEPLGLLLLLAASACGVALLARLRVPNPWVLGALLVVAVLTARGVHLSALPRWASNAGQLFIGVALGARFTPSFAHTAPRWMGSVAAGTLLMIAASAVFAWGLARLTGLFPATLMLAAAPGGIAEMAITAKVLQLGVPLVTAFQAVRYVAVILLTVPLYRWEMRRSG